MTRLLLIFFTMAIFSTSFAKTVLPFSDANARNWGQNEDVVIITVDNRQLQEKLAGSEKVWVVLSARLLMKKFFSDNYYPEFTEKCVVAKAFDFKWIEAIGIAPGQVKSNQFEVGNAKGAYYGFVLVKKAGKLYVIKPEKIGPTKKYNALMPNRVKVTNPQKLTRQWQDKNKPKCK